MKGLLALLTAAAVILLCALMPNSVWQRGAAFLRSLAESVRWDPGKQQRRAELHMLDIIRAGALTNLEARGQVPTNWLTLSNVINSELVAEICARYELPSAAQSYVVLHQPVSFNDFGHTGSVFLVRAKPYRELTRSRGRWALVEGTILGDMYGVKEQTNTIFRVWLQEDRLPQGIRAQLPN